MKGKAKISLMAIFATLLLFVFSACGSKSGEKSTAKGTVKKQIVVGVSLPTQREERWVKDKKAMIAEAKKLGITLKLQVADADSAQQASQVQNLLAQNIDVLILAPNDAASAAILVDQAKENGVPVISYDRLITKTKNLDYYISFDNYKVGVLQGTYLVNKVPKGNYMVLAGAPTDNNALLFYNGAMSIIQPLVDKGDIKIVNGTDFLSRAVENWLPEKAQAMAENILAREKNKVDAVLAPNDGTANGVINALEAQNLHIPVTGQDSEVSAIKRIIAGEQSMTIFKNTKEEARKAIQMAQAIALKQTIKTNGTVNNGAMEVPSVLLVPYVVTKSNYKKMVIDSGFINADKLKN